MGNTPKKNRIRADTRKRFHLEDEPHRQLVKQIDEGFMSAEVVRDETGNIVDWRFLEANPAIENYLWLEPSEIIGHLGSETFPEHKEWCKAIFVQVVET